MTEPGKMDIAGRHIKWLPEASSIDNIVDLDREEPLGKGAFGLVLKGKLKVPIEAPNKEVIPINTSVAVKIEENVASNDLERREMEFTALKTAMAAGCDDVVQIYDVLYDSQQETVYFVMELVKGGRIEPLAERDESRLINDYVLTIARAVSCLHQADVVHRDIKLENMVWDEKRKKARLIDLGLSCVDRCKVDERAGSQITMAPEIFLDSFDFSLDSWKQADLWSLGCAIYHLVTGEMYREQVWFHHQRGLGMENYVQSMFRSSSPVISLTRGLKGKYPMILTFLRSLLAVSPSDRENDLKLLQPQEAKNFGELVGKVHSRFVGTRWAPNTSRWRLKIRFKTRNGKLLAAGTPVEVNMQKNVTVDEWKEKENALNRVIRANCKNLVNIYDVFYEKKAQRVRTVTEWLGPRHIGTPVRKERRILLEQFVMPLLRAVSCLHEAGVVHCNIKRENVYWDEKEGQVKLTNLRQICATKVCEQRNRETEQTMAPEVRLDDFDFSLEAWKKADLWSLGCVIYRMIAGKPYPGQIMFFEAAQKGQAALKSAIRSYGQPVLRGFTSFRSIAALLMRFLQIKPKKRTNFQFTNPLGRDEKILFGKY